MVARTPERMHRLADPNVVDLMCGSGCIFARRITGAAL